MTLTDSTSTVHSVKLPLADTFRAIGRWRAARRSARVRKAAFESLLHAPEHLLRDMGISRYDLVRRIKSHRK